MTDDRIDLLAELPMRNEPRRWRQLTMADIRLIDRARYGDTRSVTAQEWDRLRQLVERLKVR